MTLHRGYKDSDEWKETNSIGPDFGYQPARAMQLATHWIFQARQSNAPADANSQRDGYTF
jgi:hypothetical protein